ncbi:MAG: hypothetical protein PHY16_14565 [Methylobacter sp.]|nr:hypothetical protein [Methylobacter sp.]
MNIQRAYLIISFNMALFAASPSYAAIAQVSVTAFASDVPSGVSFTKNVDGSPATGFAVASRTVTTVAGNASSQAVAQADALSGAIKEKVSADVVADHYVIGRNSGASSISSMGGSINLAGGTALPGLATFTAVLEGSYSVLTPAPFNFPSLDNSIRMQYTFQVGDSPEFHDNLLYSCCTPGTFSIPFTWTQVVQPGDDIFFNLFLKTDASAVAGDVKFDASNTFKINGIDLPPGYTFTSDAQGFLSQYAGPLSVPVPATFWLFGSVLALIVAIRRPGGLFLSRINGERNPSGDDYHILRPV